MNRFFCKILFKIKYIKKKLSFFVIFNKNAGCKKQSRSFGGEFKSPKRCSGGRINHFSADIDNLTEKLDKLSVLYDTGKMDTDVIKYIPGMSKVSYQ